MLMDDPGIIMRPEIKKVSAIDKCIVILELKGISEEIRRRLLCVDKDRLHDT